MSAQEGKKPRKWWIDYRENIGQEEIHEYEPNDEWITGEKVHVIEYSAYASLQAKLDVAMIALKVISVALVVHPNGEPSKLKTWTAERAQKALDKIAQGDG